MKKKLRLKIRRHLIAGGPTGAFAGIAPMSEIEKVWSSLSQSQRTQAFKNTVSSVEAYNNSKP